MTIADLLRSYTLWCVTNWTVLDAGVIPEADDQSSVCGQVMPC